MSQIDSRLDRCLRQFPNAMDVREAGVCHCKYRARMFFLTLPEYAYDRVRDGQVSGGYYCPVCDFSNAGSMDELDYDAAEVVKD